MKFGSFRKIRFSMRHGNGYGQYIIEANYRSTKIVAHTNDSEAWDYLDDDSNKEKHNNARRHCYMRICQQYQYETFGSY